MIRFSCATSLTALLRYDNICNGVSRGIYEAQLGIKSSRSVPPKKRKKKKKKPKKNRHHVMGGKDLDP